MTEHLTPMEGEIAENIAQFDHNVAEKLLNNKEELEKTLQKLEVELESIPLAGPLLADIPVLISMVRAYSNKEYTEPPLGTIVAIIATILYVVLPTDLIPDGIPVVGFADDAAAISFMIKKTEDDLNKYKQWQKENAKR